MGADVIKAISSFSVTHLRNEVASLVWGQIEGHCFPFAQLSTFPWAVPCAHWAAEPPCDGFTLCPMLTWEHSSKERILGCSPSTTSTTAPHGGMCWWLLLVPVPFLMAAVQTGHSTGSLVCLGNLPALRAECCSPRAIR